MNAPRISVASRWAWLVAIVPSLAACDDSSLTGPPEIRLGRDSCAACGMLINEDRCSTALLVERDGRREHLLFDDAGCMLDAEREGLEPARIVERYVRDFDSRAWLPASGATFVMAEPSLLPTPMGSGIVAFTDAHAAGRLGESKGGKTFDWAALVDARREWMERRFGKPAPRGD